MKKYKTSSFIIDVENSTFKTLLDSFKIVQYELPYRLCKGSSYFGRLHNWAKSKIPYSYHINIGKRKLYVLTPKECTPLELRISDNDRTLIAQDFNSFRKAHEVHIWVKLLVAEYLRRDNSFVSNDTFYIYATTNKTRTWATVLSIKVNHDYNDMKRLVINVKESATRLKQISTGDYKAYYSKNIAYGMSIVKGSPIFKQLRKDQIEEYDKRLFVKPKPNAKNKFKTKIGYHSISDHIKHETSKSYLVSEFVEKFITFLCQNNIVASQKELELTNVSGKIRGKLNIRGFNVSLIDARKAKQNNLSDFVFLPKAYEGSITIEKKDIAELDNSDATLFVMDYNNEDFKRYYPPDEDPYISFKQNKELPIPKQGICVNELSFGDTLDLSKEDYFDYKGLADKDKTRNLSICFSQLYLKKILLEKDCSGLPNLELIKGKVFTHKNHLMYIDDDKLEVRKIEDFDDFEKIVKKVTGRGDVMEFLYKSFDYNNPFSKKKDLDLNLFRLIISKDAVLEISEYSERAFYDETEVKNRIANRNKPRPISDFIVNSTAPLAIEWNEYLRDHVEETMISYEGLKSKYGKGEDGFIKQIFNFHNETPVLKYLAENTGLGIKGLKQDGIFAIHSGIWFDKSTMQYFVAKKLGYSNYDQDKSFQMRKIVVHKGTFDQDSFFPLLNIDFVRFKEYTVQPYPFKLIGMKMEMEKEWSRELEKQ